MRYWGWQGNQATIAQVLKPELRDKNVRWDEMVYYVRNHAGWLDALFRVGGDFDMLETFIANGYPIIIETGYEDGRCVLDILRNEPLQLLVLTFIGALW